MIEDLGSASLGEFCLRDFPLKERTAFGAGGRAKYAFFPENAASFAACIAAAKREGEPLAVLGCASNVLVSDRGFDGVAVFTAKMNAISCGGGAVYAECGVSAARLLEFCRLHDLGGAEFLSGIPASVGGMAAMNAGAFGREISSVLRAVYAVDGGVKKLPAEECGFSYRCSVFGSALPVFAAEFFLRKGFDGRLAERIRAMRRERQPEGRTFGSTFKNGKDYFAGELIERAGLKNCAVGGAAVSGVHANFIVNRGNATAADARELIEYIKKKVKARFGVTLCEEVRYLGEF